MLAAYSVVAELFIYATKIDYRDRKKIKQRG